MTEARAPLTLVALGGNALIRPGQRGTLAEQARTVSESLAAVIELIRRGHDVVLTHGNGPQVGEILIRAEAARGAAYDLPLDTCVAQSQGEMGYLIAACLENLLRGHGLRREVACLLTRVLVDPRDPRLHAPSKPIGPFYSAAQAATLKAQGQVLIEEPPHGFRRVVPSPWPHSIMEIKAIRRLLGARYIVVAAGGGGIPMQERADGGLAGVEAVIDKDLTSGLLAATLGARAMLNLTAVTHAKLDFGTPTESDLKTLSVSAARRHLAAGHFAPGSMGPKIEGAIHFLERGGSEVVITTPTQALAALDGAAGTQLRPD